MTRLSLATLHQLAGPVRLPAYDPAALDIGIVHLGLGAFHRAHQAVYTDDVLASDSRWGILGASLRAADTRDALQPQDGLYTLAVRDASGEALRVIGAIRGIVVAPEDPAALLRAMCSPQVRIVSLTVTEKGYCHDPATGELNEEHPDIRHDLTHPDAPRSAPGFLARALHERRRLGIAPFTILCCDNLPANGRTVRKVVTSFATLLDAAFGTWTGATVAFPCTMVDRIVPATTDADRARISAALGVDDAWPAVTEPFSQWIIEDQFPQGRPAWAAIFVTGVEPFEHMKLRLLNGAHSSLAYLGYLSGHETVADAMADPALARYVALLMRDEAAPSLKLPPGIDVEAYKADLFARFRNPALAHRTWQIAMDGSQKLPQRLLGTARDLLAAGRSIDGVALGVAAWMRYVTGIDEKGNAIDVRDPLRDDLRRRADAAGLDAAALAPALLAVDRVFGSDLPHNNHFTSAVTTALDSLIRHGARETLKRFRRSPTPSARR